MATLVPIEVFHNARHLHTKQSPVSYLHLLHALSVLLTRPHTGVRKGDLTRPQ